MSEMWIENDYAPETGAAQESNPMKVLRQMHDADSKRIKALEDQIAQLAQENKQAKVGGQLESLGIPAKAAKFYTGDADPAALAAWAEENRELFGGTAPAVQAEPQDTAPFVSPEQQVDYQRVLDAGVDGVKPAHFDDAMNAMNSATSMEELAEVFRRFG